ncbi:hypothetical protein L9F63_024252 [Diploptera punctata]|uniref:Kinetochore protein SPC25 n=1 Tax=Diploptera punctata TaxID=6984 RepID=A0AAD8E8I1_DIPPU|nr:hypothetical protein L9F63_024252 [Diploptera punctata]
MDRINNLKEPTLFSKKEELFKLFEIKYTPPLQKFEEEASHLHGLEEQIGKLSSMKDDLETKVSELKERTSLKEKFSNEIKGSEDKLAKELIISKEIIEELLLQKKQAELDKENASMELIKTNEAFLKGAMHYKKKVGIRVEVNDEDDTMIVQFLELHTADDTICHIKLKFLDNNWELLELVPHLTCRDQLARHLEHTQDIRGFLAHTRKLFSANLGTIK